MIEIDNVTKAYRMGQVEVHALRGVSLTIEQGEIISLVGASGSGKSTLMNIIGCLDKPTSGKYLLDGADVSRLSDNRLAEIRNRRFGFVFQDFNLLSRASALANVELPLIYSGSFQKRKQALEALERVGLGGRAKHKPTELSGGEQQRVAIARALVNKPSLLMADEPTGNLDSASTAEIISIFRQLNRDGITVLIVTHEMDIASQTGRTIRLVDGQIVNHEKAENLDSEVSRDGEEITLSSSTTPSVVSTQESARDTGMLSAVKNFAGAGKRTFGGIIDIVVLAVIAIPFAVSFGIFEVTNGLSFSVVGLPALIVDVLWLLYLVAMEATTGKTIGKYVAGTRVVNEAGEKISWGQSIGRNLMRIIDGIPFIIPYLVGFIGILAPKNKRRRLGDIVSKTYVIDID